MADTQTVCGLTDGDPETFHPRRLSRGGPQDRRSAWSVRRWTNSRRELGVRRRGECVLDPFISDFCDPGPHTPAPKPLNI